MPAGMRKGDWLCREARLRDGKACGNLNMAFRIECNLCNIARPDIEVVELRLALKNKQKEIDELKAVGRAPLPATATAQRSTAWAPQSVSQSVATAEAVKKDPAGETAVVVAMLAALNAALAAH